MADANIAFVDEDDQVIGEGSREEALSKGIAHRIVRVLLFNSKGELLIQKRSSKVGTAPGKWDQSVGGHVDAGEDYLTAARRETKEELGINIADFTEVTKFYYERSSDEGMFRRFNMVYAVTSDRPVKFSRDEISEVRWLAPPELQEWMQKSPDDFTPSFIKTLDLYLKQRP